MAVSDGKIQFEDVDANQIEVSVPSFPYKTMISLPFDIQKLDNGQYEIWDEGTSYDKRRCECQFFLSESEMQTFNNFFREDDGTEKGRAYDVTMRMNTGSGFHPFGPDKGDVGDFDVALIIKSHGQVQDSPFRYFQITADIENTGSWPVYSPPAEVSEGSFTIGTVSNNRYPPRRFRPKIRYGAYRTILEDSSVEWIDRSENSDSYDTTFEMVSNESKTVAVIAYLVDTVRDSDFDIGTPSLSYAFGRDIENNYLTVKLIQSSIRITHRNYNQFAYQLSLSFVSESSNATGNLTRGSSGGKSSAIDSYAGANFLYKHKFVIDEYKRLIFVNISDDHHVGSFSYVDENLITAVDTQVHGRDAISNDKVEKFIFSTDAGATYTIDYDNDGNLTGVTSETGGGTCSVIDRKRGFIFLGDDNNRHIKSYSYDNNGTLTLLGNYNFGGSGEIGYLAIDTINKLLFGSTYNTGVPNKWLKSFSYDTSGNVSGANTVVLSGRTAGVVCDSDKKLVFIAYDTNGLYSYSYTTGGILTPVDTDDQGGSAYGLAIDTISQLIFLANYSRGMETYSYDDSGNLTHVDNDNLPSGIKVEVDTINRIVVYYYDDGGAAPEMYVQLYSYA